jgi:hypothetical protein
LDRWHGINSLTLGFNDENARQIGAQNSVLPAADVVNSCHLEASLLKLFQDLPAWNAINKRTVPWADGIAMVLRLTNRFGFPGLLIQSSFENGFLLPKCQWTRGYQPPIGTQYTMDLGECLIKVSDVLKEFIAENQIKGLIREGKFTQILMRDVAHRDFRFF